MKTEYIIDNCVKRMNCLQASIRELCQKYEKNFWILFLQEWGFVYNSNKIVSIGEGIDIPYTTYFSRFLEDYMGFEITYNQDINKAYSMIIKAKSSKKEILLGIDYFDCHWSSAYQKLHRLHICIIENFDFEKQVFICKDPYLSNHTYRLEFSDLKKGFLDLRIIETIGSDKEFCTRDMQNLLIRNYLNLENEPNYYFKNLASDIEMLEDRSQLFEQDVIGNCAIFFKIKELTTNRYGISILFSNYTNGEGTQYAERFNDLACQWEMLKLLFLKLYYAGNFNQNSLKSITAKIIEIGDLEESIFHDMKVNEVQNEAII